MRRDAARHGRDASGRQGFQDPIPRGNAARLAFHTVQREYDAASGSGDSDAWPLIRDLPTHEWVCTSTASNLKDYRLSSGREFLGAEAKKSVHARKALRRAPQREARSGLVLGDSAPDENTIPVFHCRCRGSAQGISSPDGCVAIRQHGEQRRKLQRVNGCWGPVTFGQRSCTEPGRRHGVISLRNTACDAPTGSGKTRLHRRWNLGVAAGISLPSHHVEKKLDPRGCGLFAQSWRPDSLASFSSGRNNIAHRS